MTKREPSWPDTNTQRPANANIYLLYLCTAIIYSDQNLLSPNLSAAASDILGDQYSALERDEKLGGGLAFGLFVVGAPAALLIGVASDGIVRDRVALLQIVLIIGAVGCFLSAVSLNYTCLFIARSITGVSLAGGLPLINSITSDIVGSDRRTVVSSNLGLAMTAGVMFGQTLAGYVGSFLGWRWPFVMVTVMMVGMALLVGRDVVDPRMEGTEKGKLTSIGNKLSRSDFLKAWRQWNVLFKIPTFWLVLLQGLPGCIPWAIISTFLPDYLHMDASPPLSIPDATTVMNFFLVGTVFGNLAGGRLGQYLYNKSPSLPPILMFSSGTMGVLPMWYLIVHTPGSLPACSLVAAAGGFFASQTGSNIRAMLCNVTLSNQRGMAFASLILFDDLGKGAGPVLIARMIKNHGRRVAFGTGMFWWIPCAVLCGLTAFTVGKDDKASMISVGKKKRTSLRNSLPEC